MYAKILLMAVVLSVGQVYAQSETNNTNAPTTETKTQVKSKKKKKAKRLTKETAAVAPVVETAPVVQAEVKKEVPPVAPTPAQEEHTSNVFLKYLKDKFTASYHGEFYFVRRDVESASKEDHKIQDFNYMHNPTVTYKPIDNWVLLLTGEFKYSDAPSPHNGTFVNDYHRSLLTLTRKSIISEKEHGFQVDAGVGRRDYNTRTTPKTYGNNRVFSTISKTIGKHSGSLFVQYLHNDAKKVEASTWKHGLELIPTLNLQLTEKLSYLFTDDISINKPDQSTTARKTSITHEMNLAYLTYQWNDKISTYYQFKYYHNESFAAGGEKDDYFEHYAGLIYAFTPKLSLAGEIGSEIFHAYDNKSFFAEKAKYPELALYLDASF